MKSNSKLFPVVIFSTQESKGKDLGSPTEFLERGGSEGNPTPSLQFVLPAMQVDSTAKASATSAAAALAEACGTMDAMPMPCAATDAKGEGTSNDENQERASLSRSIRGRIGSLAVKKWLRRK